MSKVITISETTFKKLQELAEPLIDSTENVIEKLLRFYNKKTIVRPIKHEGLSTIQIKHEHILNSNKKILKHAKILEAKINGRKLKMGNRGYAWIGLVALTLEEASKKNNCSIAKLQEIGGFEISKDKPKANKQPTFINSINAWITRQDSDLSCKLILKLVKEIETDLYIKVKWPEAKGAYPGKQGVLEYNPSKSKRGI